MSGTSPSPVLPGVPTGPNPGVTGPTIVTEAEKAAAAAKDAERRALLRASAASRRTGQRYLDSARDLKYQIASLKDAIYNELKRNRKQNLQDIDLMLTQQLGILKEDAAKRGDLFATWGTDTEQATADAQERGIRNVVRERADSMAAILEQGAGETDAVRAMLVNTRNWHDNMAETNRTYYDTMQSVNTGIVDLNIDTRTGLANAQMTAEGKREAQWQDYYTRRVDAMTSLGNLYGTRLDYLNQAQEQGTQALENAKDAKKSKKAQAQAEAVMPSDGSVAGSRKQMKKWFAAASNELGKSYVQKPLPDWIENWEGTPTFERRQENTNLASAPVFEGVQRAQGATLRKWSA